MKRQHNLFNYMTRLSKIRKIEERFWDDEIFEPLGMSVDDIWDKLYAPYVSNQYAFATEQDKLQFENDPEKYAEQYKKLNFVNFVKLLQANKLLQFTESELDKIDIASVEICSNIDKAKFTDDSRTILLVDWRTERELIESELVKLIDFVTYAVNETGNELSTDWDATAKAMLTQWLILCKAEDKLLEYVTTTTEKLPPTKLEGETTEAYKRRLLAYAESL